MNASRLVLLASLVLATSWAQAQTLGQLIYSTRTGRAVSLKVIEGGHSTLMTLRTETGDAETLRKFVLAHAGQEGLAAKGAHELPGKAQPGWRVKVNRSETLLRNPEATYWRYTAGWVVPVRFTLLGQNWELLSADLPPRMFVATTGK
jgi:hypothetical protein